MRVLHIGKFWPPHPGGIERASADLCQALRRRGVEVAMLAHATPGERATQRRDDGIDLTLAACHGQLLYAPLSPGFGFALRRTLARVQPGLVHVHLPNVSAFWLLASRAARRLPWIVHWHADVPLDTSRPALRAAYALYRPFEQALLRRARAIIATSPDYVAASTALAPWRDKVSVVPLGIDPLPAASIDPDDVPLQDGDDAGAREPGARPVQAVSWPAAGLRVLAVGRLSHYKRFDVLVRAIAQVPGASLLLVGAGECEAALQALVRELNIEHRVRLAGRVDDAALAIAYARAQLFCLPSAERSEAFGLVLLEAMRARLPVVASDIPGAGVGHVLDRGRAGALVPPADVDALAQAIARLAADPAERDALASAGYMRWQAGFTLAQSAQRVFDLYRSLQS